ncbi:helix-hairpin-helix domain-containing protein [Streptosporangium sandarakinum]|uniref:helix-hairpin-helix domain-containing protein n=1 Tax=Streptosporangium sandarakinum TaxID=1260955 RepID=UPI0037974DF6
MPHDRPVATCSAAMTIPTAERSGLPRSPVTTCLAQPGDAPAAQALAESARSVATVGPSFSPSTPAASKTLPRRYATAFPPWRSLFPGHPPHRLLAGRVPVIPAGKLHELAEPGRQHHAACPPVGRTRRPGAGSRHRIARHFGTMDALRAATAEELQAVEGIGLERRRW